MRKVFLIFLALFSANTFAANYSYTLECEKNALRFLQSSLPICDAIEIRTYGGAEENAQCMRNLFQQYSSMVCTNSSKLTASNVLFLWTQLLQSFQDQREGRIAKEKLRAQIKTIYPKTTEQFGILMNTINSELDDIQDSEVRVRSLEFAARILRDLGAVPEQSSLSSSNVNPVHIYNFNGRTVTCVNTGVVTNCN